jgi:hypothetical protein
MASRTDLQRICEGWAEWAAADNGWFSVLHDEILCHN